MHHKRQSFPTCPSILVLVLLPEMKSELENIGTSTAASLETRIQEKGENQVKIIQKSKSQSTDKKYAKPFRFSNKNSSAIWIK